MAPVYSPLRTIAGVAVLTVLVVGRKLLAGKEILANGANDGFGGGDFGHNLSEARVELIER